MKYINTYNNSESYENDLNKTLNNLPYFLAYTKDNKKVNLKKKYTLYYSVTQYLIDNVQPSYSNKLPLITRCDLCKSIKINGESVNIDDKVREPHKFNYEENNLIFELGSLVLSNDSTFNENYVLTKHFDKPENGIIEIELNDNIQTLIGAFMFALCIVSIDDRLFSDYETNSLMSTFSSCSSLSYINLNHINSENVTNMFSLFGNCNNLRNIYMPNLNTSNVTDMNSMFMSCNGLLELDLTHFNTSKVTNMYSMFLNCKNLRKLDLSNFDTSNVKDMESMFNGCTKLEELKLNNFSISKLTDYRNMFSKCDSLNKITCTQNFKDWCIENQTAISLPISMKERGNGIWTII